MIGREGERKGGKEGGREEGRKRGREGGSGERKEGENREREQNEEVIKNYMCVHYAMYNAQIYDRLLEICPN